MTQLLRSSCWCKVVLYFTGCVQGTVRHFPHVREKRPWQSPSGDTRLTGRAPKTTEKMLSSRLSSVKEFLCVSGKTS